MCTLTEGRNVTPHSFRWKIALEFTFLSRLIQPRPWSVSRFSKILDVFPNVLDSKHAFHALVLQNFRVRKASLTLKKTDSSTLFDMDIKYRGLAAKAVVRCNEKRGGSKVKSNHMPAPLKRDTGTFT
jgi:hypothetical protein